MFRLLFIFLSISIGSHAQPSDFIILKKKNKTIRSFYQGTEIEFETNTGVYRNALITSIHDDTIFLKEFAVRKMITQFGTYLDDTLGSYSYKYDYRDIKRIGQKEKKGFNVQGSGAALFGGGLLLTVASGVYYLFEPEKFSPGLMIASAGLAGIGYLLMKSGGKGFTIGKKKYRLEYIKLSPDKK